MYEPVSEYTSSDGGKAFVCWSSMFRNIGWVDTSPSHRCLIYFVLLPFSFSSRRPQQQLKQQDEGLDMLSKSAERLGALSMGISEELGQQNKMLDGMEDDLDKATQRLDFVTKKTQEMIKRSGGKQNFLIIVGLIVVAFILILLILYS